MGDLSPTRFARARRFSRYSSVAKVSPADLALARSARSLPSERRAPGSGLNGEANANIGHYGPISLGVHARSWVCQHRTLGGQRRHSLMEVGVVPIDPILEPRAVAAIV